MSLPTRGLGQPGSLLATGGLGQDPQGNEWQAFLRSRAEIVADLTTAQAGALNALLVSSGTLVGDLTVTEQQGGGRKKKRKQEPNPLVRVQFGFPKPDDTAVDTAVDAPAVLPSAPAVDPHEEAKREAERIIERVRSRPVSIPKRSKQPVVEATDDELEMIAVAMLMMDE